MYQGPPKLFTTDLASIEASSVGGPSLARPYTKFMAANLEGVATVYVRRPNGQRRTDSPQRSGRFGHLRHSQVQSTFMYAMHRHSVCTCSP